MKRKRNRKKVVLFLLLALVIVLAAGGWYALSRLGMLPGVIFNAQDFGIETLRSPNDADGDGIDDYADILQGARDYVQTRPVYKSVYYAGGYPPQGEGVCTDVIWKAFLHAGYSLKDLVDADIIENTAAYPGVSGKPDPNIDFRRVKNLLVFFRRNAQSLTTDTADIAAWQPGDIVVYAPSHIAVVSDRRSADGTPWIIHNSGMPSYEIATLAWGEITGHFRWTPSR